MNDIPLNKEDFERIYQKVREVYVECQGNKSKTARKLNISYYKLNNYLRVFRELDKEIKLDRR